MSQEFKNKVDQATNQITELERSIVELMGMVVECDPEELNEVRRNIRVAKRHLEDAKMRFGRALLAAGLIAEIRMKSISILNNQPVVANEKGAESDGDLDNGSDN